MIELLVVISIVGILVAMLLPAVQAAREAARRVQCSDRMRQQVLALQNYHATYDTFPAGRLALSDLNHSWCSAILPELEQPAVAEQIDFARRWNAESGNRETSRTVLPVFRCPTSILDFAGDTDYGGMKGSVLSGAGQHYFRDGVFSNGILIPVTTSQEKPVSMAGIIDGTSQTITIAEVSDRLKSEHGMWADGFNIFSHDNGPINDENSGEIYSRHSGGAYIGMADGSVHFLTENVSLPVLGALATRAGHEAIEAESWQ